MMILMHRVLTKKVDWMRRFFCHTHIFQQAGSEGELCQAESLGSAGSSSTLASSVIEVEAEGGEPCLTPQLRSNQKDEVFHYYVT